MIMSSAKIKPLLYLKHCIILRGILCPICPKNWLTEFLNRLALCGTLFFFCKVTAAINITLSIKNYNA